MFATGFDLGSLCSKIAVAQKGGVDVIANETSRRKTPTLVAFDGSRRFIGESAESGWKRNIKNTIFLFKRFIGRRFDEEDVQNEIKRGLPFVLKEVEGTGEVGIQVNYEGENRIYSVKQIMAIYLGHLKDITEKATGQKFKLSDVVCGIPCWWGEAQRRALIDAIKIAGLNPIELIEETTATALTYGIYKMDLDEKNPINVIFYDLGHSSLQVSVVSFTKGGMKVLSTAYDKFLGGRDFDGVIVEKLLVMIKEKYKLDVRSDPRAFLRLDHAARQLRETLSANPKAPLFVECLMQEKDISFEFTRETFEELAKPLFERLTKPLEEVLSKAKLTKENIHSVELVGDTRATPRLQTLLTDFLGIQIGKTMNCSEAVAKGCAWQCARLSPLFHVRSFSVQTCNLFDVHTEFIWNATENGNQESTKEIDQIIFPSQNVVPSQKLITIPKTSFPEGSSLEVNLSYLGEGIPNPNNYKHKNPKHFAKFTIKNVPQNNENISKSSIKVGLKMNASGVCTISKVYKEYTETITYEAEEEVPIENEKMDTSTDENSSPSEQKMDTSNEEKTTPNTTEKKEEPKKEEKPKTKKVKVQKKRDVSKKIDLNFEESTFSLSSQEINKLNEIENKMVAQDNLIIATQIAKNAVESYVYEMNTGLDEGWSNFIEESQKESFNNLLNDTRDWLYGDGDDVAKSVYDQKLNDLKKIGDPLKKRYNESQDRQFYVDKLINVCNIVIEFSKSEDVKHEHITLEEREQIRNVANDALNWLNENLSIIKNQSLFIDPPILCSQIISRQQEVESKTNPIMHKPKPVEQKPTEQPKTEQPTTTEQPTNTEQPTEQPTNTEQPNENQLPPNNQLILNNQPNNQQIQNNQMKTNYHRTTN